LVGLPFDKAINQSINQSRFISDKKHVNRECFRTLVVVMKKTNSSNSSNKRKAHHKNTIT